MDKHFRYEVGQHPFIMAFFSLMIQMELTVLKRQPKSSSMLYRINEVKKGLCSAALKTQYWIPTVPALGDLVEKSHYCEKESSSDI